MTTWNAEGVGDIEIRHAALTLIDVGGYFTATPTEARAFALTLLEAAAATGLASHFTITGAWPRYTVTANGEYLDQTTELAPLMNMLRDRMNPGDSIVWAEQEPQEAAG